MLVDTIDFPVWSFPSSPWWNWVRFQQSWLRAAPSPHPRVSHLSLGYVGHGKLGFDGQEEGKKIKKINQTKPNRAVLMARTQMSLCTLTFIVWGRREDWENEIRIARG